MHCHPYAARHPLGTLFMTGRPHHRGGPWGRGGPGFGHGPRGFRARRGDVRTAILVLLGEEPRNGYALMQEIAERSGDAWRPGPGSVYPALAQLEDEGLIEPAADASGKAFALTDAGRAAVAERGDAPPPWQAAADHGGGRDLRDLIGQVAAAAMQVQMAGSPEQAEEARRLLEETRKALYRMLAH